jgi:two-component system, NarL family, response regulator LiaR
MSTRIRILIVDDHTIVRAGLQKLLFDETNFEVVGEAASGAEALEHVAALRPDIILMDLTMPGMDGIQAISCLRHVSPTSQVLVLTGFVCDQRVRDALQAGAVGYLLKDVDSATLVHAIHAAMRGEPWLHPEAQRCLIYQLVTPSAPSPVLDLTQRECDVLRLIGLGYSNKAIATTLHLTEGTVKGYVSAILAKLGVADRTQAALYAVKHGMVAEAA